MNLVLVDSSVWIDYFRAGRKNINEALDNLVDENRLCVNDLILAEILPAMTHKKEYQLIEIMNALIKIPLTVEWSAIQQLQIMNLKKGLNNVGIPDLLIAQNAIQNQLILFSLDNHFQLMSKIHPLDLYQY